MNNFALHCANYRKKYTWCTFWTTVASHLHIIPAGAAQLWKPMPWSSRHTVLMLMLMSEVWNAAVVESKECWRFICYIKILKKHSATPVCSHSIATEWGQIKDQIQQFYFAIIPLTVDHAIAGRRELTQIFVKAESMARCLMLYPCGSGTENTQM